MFEKIDKIFKDEKVDLHTHTNFSDGDLTPLELLTLAEEKGLLYLSITDHDTIQGLKDLKIYLELWDFLVYVIPGIEVSVKVDKGRMHLLGYGIDIHSKAINDKMDSLKDTSINSVLSIIEQLKKEYGLFFNYRDIRELINSEHNIGRPDIAKLCIKYGYTKTVQEAFDKYLIEAHKKTRTYNKHMYYEEAIDLVKKSGGIPVLAHPYSLEMNDKELLKYLKELKKVGLMGIEVYHSNHSVEQTNKYLNFANKLDLLVSGGTDFHGKTVKPGIELGSGKNNNINIKRKELSLFKAINKDHYYHL